MIAATISPNVAIAISARRKVEERRVLARSTETISDAADGVDQRIGLGIIYLATDAPDLDVDDVCGGIDMQIPDIVARGAVAEGLPPGGGEIDVVAGNRQLLDELACGFRIVLDDQNAAVTSGHDKLRATIATRLSRSGAERNRPMTIATMVRYGDASTKSLRTH